MAIRGLLVLLLLCLPGFPARQPLPPKVLAGYSNQASPAAILNSVHDGVNVVIWSFIELTKSDGAPVVSDDPVQGGPKPEDVRGVLTGLRDARRPPVAHLVSIGGWGAPHPATFGVTGAQWWKKWRAWNEEFAGRVNVSGWEGFDGVDLDVEGADEGGSPMNKFPAQLITLAGTFAEAAKADGFISTMVPPQSYLDCGSTAYECCSVEHSPSWESFPYHGQNTYAPLLAKYGDAFDLVIIQLYEGWARANYEIRNQSTNPTTYLTQFSRDCTSGWRIDFDGHFGLGLQTVHVEPSKLVIGLANGWTKNLSNPNKMLYIDGDDAGRAWQQLGGLKGLRGFGYWDIADDRPRIGLVRTLAKWMAKDAPPSGTSPDDGSASVPAAVWALLVLMTATSVAVLTLLWKRNMVSDLRQTIARLTGGEAQGDKALFEPIVSAS